MNQKEATLLAQRTDGVPINSGGNVFIVEIPLRGTLDILCLGNGGWWIEDADGLHMMDSDNIAG